MEKRVHSILISLLILNITAFFFVCQLSKDNPLKVVFFDVGQGDGIFIETPEGYQFVIDGGPDYNVMAEKISNQIPFWDKDIDGVILTHIDNDHVNGLFGVLEKYRIKNVFWSGATKEDDQEKGGNWESMLKKEKDEGGIITLAKSGRKIIAGSSTIEFLWPENTSAGIQDDINESSLVAKLCYKSNCLLFTGDISFEEENNLLNKDIKADIIKISHHGSKYSTSNDFLSAVKPSLAIIQVGKNNYGHPTQEALGRISSSGAKILRNDKDGDIEIYSDGSDFKIVTHNKR
jgi:competence protein ComEC